MYKNLIEQIENWIDRHYDDPDVEEKLKAKFSDVDTNEYREAESHLALNRAISDAYDYHLAKDIASISDYHDNFSGAILDIEKLLEIVVDASVASCFNRLLFVNVITAMETYLSDVFIGTVKKNQDLMRRFIETTPDFKNEKISLSDAFIAIDKAEKKADTYLMNNVVWHSIERVKRMYKETLGIDFPEDIRAILRAVKDRHDMVHRNGKTKEGGEIIVTKNDILELISSVKAFVQTIDTKLAKLQLNTLTLN